MHDISNQAIALLTNLEICSVTFAQFNKQVELLLPLSIYYSANLGRIGLALG